MVTLQNGKGEQTRIQKRLHNSKMKPKPSKARSYFGNRN